MIVYRIVNEHAPIPNVETAEINGPMFWLWMHTNQDNVGRVASGEIEPGLLDAFIQYGYIEIIEDKHE